MLKRWQKIVGASFLSLALLAACGTSDKEETAGGDEASDKFTIGVSQFVTHPSLDEATKGFKQAIEDSGLDVDFLDQNAQGDPNNAATIAQNLAGDEVDLIFANATPSATAALNVTKEIPIIFTSVTDPLDAKLVSSIEEPGGNVTGTTDSHPDAIPNTINFIDEQTDAKSVGVIYNAGEPNSVVQMDAVEKAADGTDLEVVTATVSNSNEVKQAAESMVGRADVFFIFTDNTVVSALESVIGVANDKKIPLFVGELDSVERGGLAAYGFSYYDIGYKAGEMAVQILKGEKEPSELAVEYPPKLDLVINKEAAEKMGVEIKPEWEDMAEIK
ncbi:ABC transporter substrate-binding protein [Pueribacillus sp. YX66]|uniref:ABC transporter substrate-binding protein n=1 Tax=Pueribacillus sp. YX66 TaxID=3229242 RepID=UPI00358D0F04